MLNLNNERFEDYYRSLYGARWEKLRKSLLENAKTVDFADGLTLPYRLDYASVLAAKSLRLPDDLHEDIILDACAAPGGKSLVLLSRMNAGLTLLSMSFQAKEGAGW